MRDIYKTKKNKKMIRMSFFLLFLLLGISSYADRECRQIGKNEMNCRYANASERVQYTYDKLGRVKTATYSDGSQMIYDYDKNGNIVSVKKKQTDTQQKEWQVPLNW